MIPTRIIPRSAIAVTEIGFGAATLGNLYAPISDADASASLQTALDAGINYVDTAPHYGHGLSERRVGDGLRSQDGIVLSSKVGRLLSADPALKGDAERHGFRSPLPFGQRYDYSYDGIMRSHEDSLLRLGLATIDLLFVHDIGRLTHGSDHARAFAQLTIGGGFRALEQLRTSGAVRGFGLGVNEWEICLDAMNHADLDVILLAGRYTLLEQTAIDRFMPACLEREIGVIIGGAYNSGILATGTRQGGPLHYDYGVAPADIVARVRSIEDICARYDVPLAAAALQFPLAHPAVVSVVPGLSSAARVARTMQFHATDIPSALWTDLRENGLLHRDAPTPVDK